MVGRERTRGIAAVLVYNMANHLLFQVLRYSFFGFVFVLDLFPCAALYYSCLQYISFFFLLWPIGRLVSSPVPSCLLTLWFRAHSSPKKWRILNDAILWLLLLKLPFHSTPSSSYFSFWYYVFCCCCLSSKTVNGRWSMCAWVFIYCRRQCALSHTW